MKQIKTTAIVTRTADFRDYDRMITLLSPQDGRLDICLKGCRKQNAKLRAAGQMFCFADFELLNPRPGPFIVTSCDVRDSFFSLTQDVDRMLAAGKLCALSTMLFDAQQDAQRELFALLLSAVTTLAYAPRVNASEIVLLCAARILKICGYEPQTDFCVECGSPVEKGNFLFNAAMGGVMCESCAARVGGCMRLSPGAVSSLRMAQELPNTKMATFHFSAAVREEVKKTLTAFLSHRLEQPVSL